MEIGKPRGDIPVMHGTFEASTEIWDIGTNFPVVVSKMRLSHEDLEPDHQPCFSSIHCGFFDSPV